MNSSVPAFSLVLTFPPFCDWSTQPSSPRSVATGLAWHVCVLLSLGSHHVNGAEPQDAYFESRAEAVLKAKCSSCHQPKKAEGELDLTSAAGVREGGESGSVIDEKDWRKSLLWQRIADSEMPPDDSPQLTSRERDGLRAWLESGAKFRNSSLSKQLDFHDVNPLLLLRCTVCHGGRRREADLDLRTRESILRGGKSGPAIVPGNPSKSLLVQRIVSGDMPPRRQLVKVSVKPMAAQELERLKKWIQQGAKPAVEQSRETVPVKSEHWAFQPPRYSSPTTEMESAHADSMIDAHLIAALKKRKLSFSPPAEPLVWLRRVTLDLTGLPPTPKDALELQRDGSPLARERVVDRLLASSRYGERWAQVWLDATGYADSEGSQNEDRIRADIFRYRDYVIRSFNQDKPYRRFLLEQIAGDELADYRDPDLVTPQVFDNIVATGFLRTAPDRTFAGITNFVPDRLELVADEIQILGSAVMGLTLHCARCHSHKFDPISQRDYYGLAALLKDAYDEHDWLMPEDRKLSIMPRERRKEMEHHNGQLQLKIDALVKKKDAASQLSSAQTGESKKSEANKSEVKKRLDELSKQIKSLEQQKRSPWRLRALWSRGTPSPTYLLRRGDYLKAGPIVGPSAPASLVTSENPFRIEVQRFGKVQTTGRRLAIANWLTRDSHPLTSRVIVNRIWASYFGRGLVRTLGNFGVAGELPTHPQLLDSLAVQFVRDGWSLKRLHRRIVLSRAYAQTSKASAESLERDFDGRWLSRMPLRRMSAEMVRDSLIYAGGRLREHPFGKPDSVNVTPAGLSVSIEVDGSWRRSIYVLHRRTQMPTILENFDSPQMSPNCVQRRESIVATQALNLMNNRLVQQLAHHFAQRVITETPKHKRLDYAFQLATGRPPSVRERKISRDAFSELKATWLESGAASEADAETKALTTYCHGLLNSAAFIYID